MAIAMTLREYLEQENVHYQVLAHSYTRCSAQTAQAAHIPGDQLAKSVLLEDEEGYLMAVIPSTHRVEIGKLHKQLNRNLGLATEQELDMLFDDCEIGAVPPVGQAYGIEVIVDDTMCLNPDVYFEAGDHTDLIHISGKDFGTLMANAQRGHFSKHT
ncbi:MAG: YbaK/EbsC family protein [Gammaproteobacteria bacterium]|nr:YbaK/EbsC family protein [Gammaproteobacteria bacterium]